MADAFIIMQIGNPELDLVCGQAIVPALDACGLDAKRVDKHNQGGLLKNEIIGFIERADVIVADLTNERPNCYLEVGYTMGIDKFRNLILTVREDHYHESQNYKNGGPKIHFDLSGYDILFWDPKKLDEFKQELEKRIKRRLAILAPQAQAQEPVSPWDNEWVKSHRDIAAPKLQLMGKTAFMEVHFTLNHPKPWKTQQELDEAARTSTISTFGWPIGVYLGNQNEYRPRPKADGIVAEIEEDGRHTYDYWAIRRNGDYFLFKTIFEDDRDSKKIFFDTRIIRVTEVLLYCARLYNRLNIDSTTVVNIIIRHGGLNGRVLGAANSNRAMNQYVSCAENEIESEVSTQLSGIEGELVRLVRELVTPLFTLFDFFELPDQILEEIVNAYVEGRVI
jgi:hypothetical protein